jgi:hypothetical protein
MKLKLLFKISCVVMAIVICAIICRVGYLWGTYIDETITSGEGYGFEIGETKEQVYYKASEFFQDSKVFFLYPLDEQGIDPEKEFKFSTEEYKVIKNRDVWKFYSNESFIDFITLAFKKGELVEIRRRRQKFELP